jgi:hypothetical protein
VFYRSHCPIRTLRESDILFEARATRLRHTELSAPDCTFGAPGFLVTFHVCLRSKHFTAAAAPKMPKPGRGKRLRKRDNADYEPFEPETESEVDSEEDKAKKKKGKKKGTRSRKKARTADAETGPQ